MFQKHKWWGLLALMPSIAMTFADQSILPVALPKIQEMLGATNIELQWSVNSYLLATAVLVLVGGKLGDRLGHRFAFSLGILIFAIASLLCGLSPNLTFLIAARALQGVGAALMYPASTALLSGLFPPSERGRATGIVVSAGSVFLIMGPLLGGYLTQSFSWRWIFWVNIPLAAIGLWLIYLFIPPSPKGKEKIDLPGFLLFTVGSTALVTAIMEGREWGWLSYKTMVLLTLTFFCSALLVWREKWAKHPFLDLKLFLHPVYRAINISVFSTQFIMMITVFWSIYFQKVLDYTPLGAGTITFASSLPVLFMAPAAGFLADRFGSKLPIAIGFLLLIFSFFWLSVFGASPIGTMIYGLLAFGVGIPFILTPSYSAAMGTVAPTKRGIAFGTLATVRSLAASLGVAAIGSLIYNFQFSSFETRLGHDERMGELNPSLYVAEAPEAQRSFAALPEDVSLSVHQYLREAEISGFSMTNLVLAFLLILAFVAVFIFYRRKATHHLPETPSEGWD